MSVVSIGEAVTGGALRATNFFNGRLLTGEDLGREQAAQSARLARLGEALGDGVVDGFAISVKPGSTAAKPIVSVSPGLAIARSGDALELREPTDVALAASSPSPGAGSGGGQFSDCQPNQPSEYSTGTGVYLLSVGPAVTKEGLAPVSGPRNADTPCNTAYAVEGVSFRRLRLALPLDELNDGDRLRNRVAYRMFAPAATAQLQRNPFGAPLRGYGLLDDELRPDHLHDDEVPLALIGWVAGQGITFIDHWSVRRRPTLHTAPDPLAPLAADRLLAEGEARLLQFQEHLDDIPASARPTVAARKYFTHLPAAGLLPTGPNEFTRATFFTDVKTREPVFIEGPELEHLLRLSAAYPPIELPTAELIWLYDVRVNVVAGAAAKRFVVFAHGHTPYFGDARYHRAYFDQANYALTD